MIAWLRRCNPGILGEWEKPRTPFIPSLPPVIGGYPLLLVSDVNEVIGQQLNCTGKQKEPSSPGLLTSRHCDGHRTSDVAFATNSEWRITHSCKILAWSHTVCEVERRKSVLEHVWKMDDIRQHWAKQKSRNTPFLPEMVLNLWRDWFAVGFSLSVDSGGGRSKPQPSNHRFAAWPKHLVVSCSLLDCCMREQCHPKRTRPPGRNVWHSLTCWYGHNTMSEVHLQGALAIMRGKK